MTRSYQHGSVTLFPSPALATPTLQNWKPYLRISVQGSEEEVRNQEHSSNIKQGTGPRQMFTIQNLLFHFSFPSEAIATFRAL